MRLIDADEFVRTIKAATLILKSVGVIPEEGAESMNEIIAMINNQPTVEERKTGEWFFEEYPDGYYHSQCSVCENWFTEDAFLKPYKYCPNCGAEMREREREII